MNVIFDKIALVFFRSLGYSYFCYVTMETPDPDPNEGLCVYIMLIPFENSVDAYKYCFAHWSENGAMVVKKENVEKLAEGVSGLAVYIKSEDVFS